MTVLYLQVENANGKPFQLIGDGQYHNYTIEWHSGGSLASYV